MRGRKGRKRKKVGEEVLEKCFKGGRYVIT